MSSNLLRDLEVAENYPIDSQAMSSNLLQLKQAMRATWMAGDFGQIARYMEKEAEAFVERLGFIPGMKVLDCNGSCFPAIHAPPFCNQMSPAPPPNIIDFSTTTVPLPLIPFS